MKLKLFLSFTLLIAISVAVIAQNPKEIASKSNEMVEFESMEMLTTLNIYDARGNVRVRDVAVATRKFGEVTKTLMRFMAPPEVKGTSILVYDYPEKSDDMWVYLPSLRKSRRIVSTEKGKSFMGSEFSNADMSRPNLNDFTYKLLGSQKLNGKDCWVVEASVASSEVDKELGYAKRVSYTEKSTYLTHKSELLDKSGKVLKVMTLNNFQRQKNGRYFAYEMRMENMQSKRYSEMKVKSFQLGSSLSEEKFSVSSLEN